MGGVSSKFIKTAKTDAILLVQTKEMHVNKALLSYHSDYFKTLFNSTPGAEVFKIDDVDYEDFGTMLSLVQDDPCRITKSNAENLLELADRFQLQSARCHVEQFIIASVEFSKIEKLILADKYKLIDLAITITQLFNCKEAFREFSEIRNELSERSRIFMYELFFQRFGNDL